MSRSYKKAVIKYAPFGNYGKKKANRAVRRATNLQSGGAYKKVYSQYDIHDLIYDGRFERYDDLWKVDKVEYAWRFNAGIYTARIHGAKIVNGCWVIPK